MKRWHIISVLLFSYCFFMIANIPASRVIHFLQQKGSIPAAFYGVQGSIWQGYAKTIDIPGQPRLENVEWSVNPFALLLARLSSEITADIHKQPLTGEFSKHFIGGDVYASDITTKLPAGTLQKMLDLPFGELGGDFEIYLDSMHLQQDMLPQIEARIFWQHAKLTLDQAIDMGQVEINILTDDANQTQVTLANNGGDLAIRGDANIGTDRNYIFNVTMKPKDATGNVAQSLNLFAQRQADGSYRFKQNGNLRQLGF